MSSPGQANTRVLTGWSLVSKWISSHLPTNAQAVAPGTNSEALSYLPRDTKTTNARITPVTFVAFVSPCINDHGMGVSAPGLLGSVLFSLFGDDRLFLRFAVQHLHLASDDLRQGHYTITPYLLCSLRVWRCRLERIVACPRVMRDAWQE